MHEVLEEIDQTAFMPRVMTNYCSSKRTAFNPFGSSTVQSCAISYNITDEVPLFKVLVLLTFKVFWVWVFPVSDVDKRKNSAQC